MCVCVCVCVYLCVCIHFPNLLTIYLYGSQGQYLRQRTVGLLTKFDFSHTG